VQSKMKLQHARFRFSMGQSTRKEFFAKLQTCNITLKELLELSGRIYNPEQNTLLSGYPVPVKDVGICEFWQHAQEVYEAFSRAWHCSCRYQHQTQVMLQHRKSDDRDLRLILRKSDPDHNGTQAGQGIAIRESPYPEGLRQNQTLPPSQSSKQPKYSLRSLKLGGTKQAVTKIS
jgi:hypothetical protein